MLKFLTVVTFMIPDYNYIFFFSKMFNQLKKTRPTSHVANFVKDSSRQFSACAPSTANVCLQSFEQICLEKNTANFQIIKIQINST